MNRASDSSLDARPDDLGDMQLRRALAVSRRCALGQWGSMAAGVAVLSAFVVGAGGAAFYLASNQPSGYAAIALAALFFMAMLPKASAAVWTWHDEFEARKERADAVVESVSVKLSAWQAALDESDECEACLAKKTAAKRRLPVRL